MKIIFILILVFLASNVKSQTPTFFNKENIGVIKKITEGALYILRQDFYILDTTVKPNIKSGFNGNNYFGRYYFIGLYADGKFYTDRNINTPWELDERFNSIKGLKKYIPVLSNFAYRQIDSSTFMNIDSLAEFNKGRLSDIDTNMLYAAIRCSVNLPMLHLAENNEKMLDSTSFHWALNVKESKEFNKMNYTDTIPSIEYDLSKGKYSLDRKAYLNSGFYYNDKTIGGFVFTTRPGLGRIDYLLSGMIVKNKLGKFESVIIQKSDQIKIDDKKNRILIKLPDDIKKNQSIPAGKITEIKDN